MGPTRYVRIIWVLKLSYIRISKHLNLNNSLWKTYKNGVFIGSNTINHGGAADSLIIYHKLYVGSRGRVGDLYSNMEFGSLSFYDKALTASEVSQNYNALKGRFGL